MFRFVHREMRGFQALHNLQLKGVQLSKTQMERLVASSAMARFLYKGPAPRFTVDAQFAILPKSRAQPASVSPVLNGVSAVLSRGQGFHNFMFSSRRGYLNGRSYQGIISVSGIRGEGSNGSDRESPDSSFFGIAIFWNFTAYVLILVIPQQC